MPEGREMTLDQVIATLEAEPNSVERKCLLAIARELKRLRADRGGKAKAAGAGKAKTTDGGSDG